MLYNLSNPYEIEGFKEYVNKLYKKKAVVEVKEKHPNRTLKQNSYLHVILGYFACEFGLTMDDVKHDIFKKEVNKDLFVEQYIDKRGINRTRTKHTYELDSSQMTIAIDRFRNWSAMKAGLYIPSPNEKEAIVFAEQQIQRNQLYL